MDAPDPRGTQPPELRGVVEIPEVRGSITVTSGEPLEEAFPSDVSELPSMGVEPGRSTAKTTPLVTEVGLGKGGDRVAQFWSFHRETLSVQVNRAAGTQKGQRCGRDGLQGLPWLAAVGPDGVSAGGRGLAGIPRQSCWHFRKIFGLLVFSCAVPSRA